MPQLPNQATTNKSFEDFYLSDSTLKAIRELGYETPTPVQIQSIPLVIAGIDLTVMSQTGTGKTAAFAIPTVEILDPVPGQIDVLVLAPTRELAIQVAKEFERVGKFKGIHVATIFGGSSYGRQYDEIETANVIVATPGRLLDLLKDKKCDLSGLKHFILDEADEMLSMGFADALDQIIDFLPEDRQSLLFSATITNEVKSLAKKLLFFPEFISMSDDSVGAQNVTHVWYPVRGVGRIRELLRVIEFEQPDQAIVFANTKNDTFRIAESLTHHGIPACVLNGDLPQSEREQALKSLKNREFSILVATDVAARGIDVSGLTHVFNYCVPENAEVYIHRAGRTGRAGAKGRAISLVSPAEFPTLHMVKKHYGIVPQQSEIPTTRQIIAAKRQKYLDNLAHKLTQDFDLPYGAKIGLARQLVEHSTDNPDATILIARLLTLSDALLANPNHSLAKLANLPITTSSSQKTSSSDSNETSCENTSNNSNDSDTFVETFSQKKLDPTPKHTPEKSSQNYDSNADFDIESRESGRSRRRRGKSNRVEQEIVVSISKNTKDFSEKKSSRRNRKQPEPETPYIKTRNNNFPFVKTDFEYKKMWINLGASNFNSEKELRDALIALSGFEEEDFGPISLEPSFSYVDVREDYFDDVLFALNEQQWNGNFIAVEAARK